VIREKKKDKKEESKQASKGGKANFKHESQIRYPKIFSQGALRYV